MTFTLGSIIELVRNMFYKKTSWLAPLLDLSAPLPFRAVLARVLLASADFELAGGSG
jgi:hypothetical protein